MSLQSRITTETVKSLMEKMKLTFTHFKHDTLPLGKDAIISGSFLWHLLTAESRTRWLPGDVDVFCTVSGAFRLREFLVNNNYKLGYSKLYEYNRPGLQTASVVETWFPCSATNYANGYNPVLLEEKTAQEDARVYFNSFCDGLHIPRLPKNTVFARSRQPGLAGIQLIIGNCNDVLFSDAKEFIIDSFDLPTLENWWDGTTAHISYPDMVEKRLTTVCNRFTDWLTDKKVWRQDRLEQRIQKYKKYGLNLL